MTPSERERNRAAALQPIFDRIAKELRSDVHGHIQTIRGMCTDEEPHETIDQALAALDEVVYGLADRLSPSEREARDALEAMYCHTVIPRRSVDRIRRALAEGRDPEPFLADVEGGLKACVELMERERRTK